MAKVLITESCLEDIADAIRAKNGSSGAYRPADMATAINALKVVTILSGTTEPTAEEGSDSNIYLLYSENVITAAYIKVSGTWVNFVGANVSDIVV